MLDNRIGLGVRLGDLFYASYDTKYESRNRN